MNKAKIALVTLLSVFVLAGCSSEPSKDKSNNEIFKVVSNHRGFDVGYQILVDRKTDIVYYKDVTSYKGGITPLYNKDGVPMNYDEFKKLDYLYE